LITGSRPTMAFAVLALLAGIGMISVIFLWPQEGGES
jgi:hypothetical protein